MAMSIIEMRVLGLSGRPYVELGNELRPEFEKEGVILRVPRLFSVPVLTTVFVQIGIGVAVFLLSKLVDRLLEIRKRDEQKKTEITVNIEINNQNYRLPEEAEKLVSEYSTAIEKHSSGNEDTAMTYKNVNDDERAGNTQCYVETYQFFHEGLRAILKEISNIEDLTKELQLPESPYKYDKKRMQNMIRYAEEDLHLYKKNKSDKIEIRGISWGSLRYLKAGLLMKIDQLEEKKKNVLQNYGFLPANVVETLDKNIKELKGKTETGMFEKLKPAEIYFSIKKMKENILPEPERKKNKELIKKEVDNMKWDIFISHASEDKEAIVRPLANALASKGIKVWYDDFTLKLGDSLRRSVDKGLANSKYGVVVFSKNFFAKEWPQKELDGLVNREINGRKVILPVWHEISQKEVAEYSPMLADKVAVKTSAGINTVVESIIDAINI